MHYLIAISYAIVLWWVSTGIIIVLYRQARWTYDATFGGMSIVAAACAVALVLLRENTQTWAVYASFSAGTVVWGWNLASYYTGFITGQRVELPALPLTNHQRFVYAVKSTISSHFCYSAVPYGVFLGQRIQPDLSQSSCFILYTC